MTLTLTAAQCTAFIISYGRGDPALYEPRCIFSVLPLSHTVDSFMLSASSAASLVDPVTITCSMLTTFTNGDLQALLPNATLVESVTP